MGDVEQARERLRSALAEFVRAIDPDSPGRFVTDYVVAVQMMGEDPTREWYHYDGSGTRATCIGMSSMLLDVMSDDDT